VSLSRASRERSSAKTAGLAEVEAIAWLLDNSIPVPLTGGRRVGLDAVIGLVPILGDALGAGIGLFVVWRAARLGVPRVAVARMLVTSAIDMAVGAIPVVGDAFDLWFKANSRNLRVMRRYLEQPDASTRGEWGTLAALIGSVILVVVIVGWLIVTAVGALLAALI
jgi:hypothetical protein